MTLLFLLFIYGSFTQHITISDPHCRYELNQYGIARLNYDILGQMLTVSFSLDTTMPLYSCYLCDSVAGDYCNATKANIDLSYDLSYNVMTLLMDARDNRIVTRQVFDLAAGERSFQLPLNGTNRPLRLIAILFCTVESPSALSFLTVLRDDHVTHRLACHSNALLFEDIDCDILDGNYYYIPVETPNSVVEAPVVEIQNETINNRPLFYWYKESLASVAEMPMLRWCGIDWHIVMSQSGLSFECGHYASLYVDIKPWYRLALEYTTARLNIAIMGTSVTSTLSETLVLANDILERTCTIRNAVAEPVNNTFFASTYAKLREFNSDTMEGDWCREVVERLNRTDLDAGLVPYYVSLYTEWYFRYFSPFILYTKDMWPQVIIALALLSTAVGIFVFCITVVPAWLTAVHCYMNRDRGPHYQEVFTQYEML